MSDTNSAPEATPEATPAPAIKTESGEVAIDGAAGGYSDAVISADALTAAENGAEIGDAAAAAATAAASAPAQPTVQTVYITAPTPPKPKGNRLIGVLLAVAATVAFAIAFAGFAAILVLLTSPTELSIAVPLFLASPFFYLPVLVFLVTMILWAILANRAAWWSWVLGSFVIAAVVYFASIGILLLMAGGISLTAVEASEAFTSFATNPALIASALIARECAIWFGGAIAKNGRKVRERNYAAWQAFENEEARKRAEFGGPALS